MTADYMPAEVVAWINTILIWVGFGTIVGLLGRAIMPGHDPAGAIVTLCMGVGGTVIGCGLAMFLFGLEKVTPVSPLGFGFGTLGALLILAFYRLLAGYYLERSESPVSPTRRRRRRRVREYDAVVD